MRPHPRLLRWNMRVPLLTTGTPSPLSHARLTNQLSNLKLRTQLDIPVPKILGYCSRDAESRIGAEYIIMEKAAGVELAQVWGDLEPRDKVSLVKQLADISSRLGENRFSSYGALYFQKDLSQAEKHAIDDTFAIGPTTARAWFDDRRNEVDVHRCPCTFFLSH